MSRTSMLEEIDTRTIGINLFSWDFSSAHKAAASAKAETRKYNITLWDFAGQNKYQSAHSLFYSKRTTYLLCVDLKAYADELASATGISESTRRRKLDLFAKEHIYAWIRVICAHQPESEFVFIVTEADLIDHDKSKIKEIEEDLFGCIKRLETLSLQKLQREIDVLKQEESASRVGDDKSLSAMSAQITKLDELIKKRPQLHTEKLHVVSSDDLYEMEQTHEELQRLIVDSDNSFQMPENYSKVCSYLCSKAWPTDSTNQQVREVFVDAEQLKQEIQNNSDSAHLSTADITAILHVFHDLGDVLWFDEKSQLLSKTVFPNLGLVIDFIRQVFNHTMGDETNDMSDEEKALHRAVRNEGRVPHELLNELDLWREVEGDDELMRQLKELFFYFNLAYPVDEGGLKWGSDLIMPMYSKKHFSEHSGDSRDPAPKVLKECAHWEYEFQLYLPDNLFERYIVQSYSVHIPSKRFFSRDTFDAISTECHVRVSLPRGKVPKISICVWAAERDETWKHLVLYVMNLEKLLDGYPGMYS